MCCVYTSTWATTSASLLSSVGLEGKRNKREDEAHAASYAMRNKILCFWLRPIFWPLTLRQKHPSFLSFPNLCWSLLFNFGVSC